MIYINGRFLTQRMTGVQRYAIEICKELIKLDKEVRIIVSTSFRERLNHEISDLFKEHLVYWGIGSGFAWEQVHLSLFFLRNKGIILNLCNTAPLFIGNKLTCIHDMSYKANESWFSQKIKIYYSFLIPAVIKTSRFVITVSEFSKSEIRKYVPQVNSEEISIIYPACGIVFRQSQFFFKRKETNTFLFVGSLEPRKNLESVLKAFSFIQNADVRLVIVGGKNKKIFKDAGMETNSYLKDSRIVWEYSCSDTKLKQLYATSKALLNPSFYEGFGLPLLEAINWGCLLCVSDIPVFREVTGNNALFFDPNNTASIKEVIERVVRMNHADIEEIAHKAFDYSKKFSYKSSAEKLYNLVR